MQHFAFGSFAAGPLVDICFFNCSNSAYDFITMPLQKTLSRRRAMISATTKKKLNKILKTTKLMRFNRGERNFFDSWIFVGNHKKSMTSIESIFIWCRQIYGIELNTSEIESGDLNSLIKNECTVEWWIKEQSFPSFTYSGSEKPWKQW